MYSEHDRLFTVAILPKMLLRHKTTNTNQDHAVLNFELCQQSFYTDNEPFIVLNIPLVNGLSKREATL